MDSDPQVTLQIDTTARPVQLSIISFTRALLQGMDDIVREMRNHGGDGPIPTMGYILVADDVAIDLYTDVASGDHFTRSVAETVLRGTWELLALYGFSSVVMEIFLGSQAALIRIGDIVVGRTQSNRTVAAAVRAATDT